MSETCLWTLLQTKFQKISHLNFNRPSDQLSARTPPAIVDADVRANASPSPLSKFRRSRSAHTPSLSSSRLAPHRYQSPSPKSAIFNTVPIPSAETPPPLRTSATGQFAR